MKQLNKLFATQFVLAICLVCFGELQAQSPEKTSGLDGVVLAKGGPSRGGQGRGGRGRGGHGHGRGMQGRGGQGNMDKDHEVLFYLIEHRAEITRKVTKTANGIETVTESQNPEVTAKIQEHVAAMYKRVENVQPIHMRDPLFRALFGNAKKIKMEMQLTKNGIRVRETSADPLTIKLVQAHADVVSLFLKNGFAEVRKNHPVPQ